MTPPPEIARVVTDNLASELQRRSLRESGTYVVERGLVSPSKIGSAQTRNLSSLLETDTAHEVLKARVGADAIESGINPEKNEVPRSFQVGFVQPRKCLIIIP